MWDHVFVGLSCVWPQSIVSPCAACSAFRQRTKKKRASYLLSPVLVPCLARAAAAAGGGNAAVPHRVADSSLLCRHSLQRLVRSPLLLPFFRSSSHCAVLLASPVLRRFLVPRVSAVAFVVQFRSSVPPDCFVFISNQVLPWLISLFYSSFHTISLPTSTVIM